MHQVNIFNLRGQTIKSIALDKKECLLQINDLPSGMYILKVNSSTGISSQLIIKQ
jgi:hypothetical protein